MSAPSSPATPGAAPSADPRAMRSFAEFYPFYLGEHRNPTCRRLHFLGSSLALACLAAGVVTGRGGWFLGALACGYGFAWIGHFVFEKNRPASFKRPLWSFLGDWRMYFEIWTRRIPF